MKVAHARVSPRVMVLASLRVFRYVPPLVLDVDEEATSARGQQANSEASVCCVADVVGELSGHERLDTSLDNGDVWHGSFSCL